MLRTVSVALFFTIALSSVAEAQLVHSFGLKVGASATSEDWQYAANIGSIDAKTRWGIDVGTFVEWFNIPVWSLSSEIHYIQKGFKVQLAVTTPESPDGNGSVLTLSPRVDYLSIPILAKCRLELGLSTLYVIAGPRIDFFLSSEDDGFGDVISKFKSTEYGVTIGLGFLATSMGPLGLGAEIRYSPTLQDSYSTNLLSVRNRSLEMLLVLNY